MPQTRQSLRNLNQTGQDWMGQVNQFGQQAGNVAGNLANWDAQNPYQNQTNAAFNQLGGGGFNADALAAFGNQFNPNTGSQYGGGQPQQPPGSGMPQLPTQGAPPPSQQVDIGMGQGADQRFNPQQGGGMPPNIGAPMAPGAGGNTSVPAGAMGGMDWNALDPGITAQAASGAFTNNPLNPTGGQMGGLGGTPPGGGQPPPVGGAQPQAGAAPQQQQAGGGTVGANLTPGTGGGTATYTPPGGQPQQPQAGGGAPGGGLQATGGGLPAGGGGYDTRMPDFLTGGGQPQQPPPAAGGAGGQPGGGATNPFGVNLNQAAGPGTTTDFTGTQTTAPTPQAPGQGAGGAYNEAMLGGGQQAVGQFGGFGADVGTAQSAQLSGLLNQAQGAGMSQAQQDQMFAAQYDPAAQAIGKSQNQALAQLSARGMGRSSAGVGNVEGERMSALGNVAQQAGANVTGQNLALTQRQSEFGLQGLGQFAGQGIGAALGAGGLQNQMQGTANAMNLGMGNLGLGTEQLGTGNQMQMNQQQMQAQQQQFSQDNARAGMDLARYQTEQGFNMDQYKTDLQAQVASGQLDEQTAARMADNALQTTSQGLQAQGMQNQNNQALMNAALGLGNQALDYSGQNLQGQAAGGGMYSDLAGQFGNLGLGAQGLYQGTLGGASAQRANERASQRQARAAGWTAAGNLAGNLIPG